MKWSEHMKKIVSLACALVLCLSMALPAFAATKTFVPSISYKDGPELVEGSLNGEDVTDCLVLTSIPQAQEKATDISEEENALLLDVYAQLSDGTMKLPLDNDRLVIRELVDFSFGQNACVIPGHTHKADLAADDTTLTADFDLGLAKGIEVVVMAYVGGEWIPVEAVNNDDGTVTCVFEDICPVVFCVEEGIEEDSPKTGDTSGTDLILWGSMMLVSAAVLLALVARQRKRA